MITFDALTPDGGRVARLGHLSVYVPDEAVHVVLDALGLLSDEQRGGLPVGEHFGVETPMEFAGRVLLAQALAPFDLGGEALVLPDGWELTRRPKGELQVLLAALADLADAALGEALRIGWA